jgi:anoctamin-10
MGEDPVTGLPTPSYPITKTWSKEYGLSLPVVLVCLFCAFQVMLIYFEVETLVMEYYVNNPSNFGTMVGVNIPGIVYAVIVMVMNRLYRTLATKLNDYENHRTQSSHENHLIVKLILFEFVNNFMSIFYVAFYVRDMSSLKWQIGTMLIVYQIVDNVQEVFLPLLETRGIQRSIELYAKKNDYSPVRVQVVKEGGMPVYEDTYYDFLELYIQFGFVFLFLSVFPLAPVLALVNNWIELKSDALKLCIGHQRPHPRKSSRINGAWLKAFQVMAILAVMSNSALFALSYMDPPLTVEKAGGPLVVWVTIEHLVLALFLIIGYLVPDVPKHVNVAIMKRHHRRTNQGSSQSN